MTDKQKLIEALKAENKDWLSKGLDVTDHKAAILYLETGEEDESAEYEGEYSDNYELYWSAKTNLETLINDYTK